MKLNQLEEDPISGPKLELYPKADCLWLYGLVDDEINPVDMLTIN